MNFSEKDCEYMAIALGEARRAFDKGEYPVGAVLVIEGKIVGKISNLTNSEYDWASHAEAELIRRCSKKIKERYLPTIENKSLRSISVELYTTLEPCLMCLGSAILNRITRIVYSAKDPHGGAAKLSPKDLPAWYLKKWPIIEGGLYEYKSRELLISFMRKRKESYWKETLKLFEEEYNDHGKD